VHFSATIPDKSGLNTKISYKWRCLVSLLVKKPDYNIINGDVWFLLYSATRQIRTPEMFCHCTKIIYSSRVCVHTYIVIHIIYVYLIIISSATRHLHVLFFWFSDHTNLILTIFHWLLCSYELKWDLNIFFINFKNSYFIFKTFLSTP